MTVRVEARNRSTVDRTTIDVVPGGDDSTIEIRRGTNLHWNFCNDVISREAEPTATHSAVAGSGVAVLDPRRSGPVSGSVIIEGLEAVDGTTFAPIRIESDRIGSYAG